MNTSPMNFDSIDLIEVPVTVCGKSYVLRQASSKIGELYRSKEAQCVKSRMENDELSGIEMEGIGSLAPYLVSLMLKEVREDGSRGDVPTATINCWPDGIIKALFARCKEISPDLEGQPTKENLLKQRKALDRRLAKMEKVKGGEDAAKNSPTATTVGSA